MKMLLKRWIISWFVSILLVAISGCGYAAPASSENPSGGGFTSNHGNIIPTTIPTKMNPGGTTKKSTRTTSSLRLGDTTETGKSTPHQQKTSSSSGSGSRTTQTNNSSASTTGSTSTTALSPSLTPEEAAWRTNNRSAYPAIKLNSQRQTVYQPVDSWGYSHHAAIQYFKGKYYAVFSNGRENEDDCGQRIMISVSDGSGNWNTPKPLVDSIMGKSSQLVLVNAGMYSDGNTLVVYYGSYEYRPESLRGENLRPLQDVARMDHAMWQLSTTDGKTWTAPQRMNIPFGCNFGPLPLKSGRLLMCGGTTYPYTDDPTGLTGFITGTIYAAGAIERGAKIINEGSFFQTDDGIIHMMLRTNTDYLWCAESRNDGETWSEPYPTQFTDDHSKFQFGRLPDGRYFYVGNPYPGSNRNPLMLCLSEDGVNFDRHYILRDEPYQQRLPGLYKGGVYGYPSVNINDGYMFVIYSKHKEAIEVTKFSLSDL